MLWATVGAEGGGEDAALSWRGRTPIKLTPKGPVHRDLLPLRSPAPTERCPGTMQQRSPWEGAEAWEDPSAWSTQGLPKLTEETPREAPGGRAKAAAEATASPMQRRPSPPACPRLPKWSRPASPDVYYPPPPPRAFTHRRSS